MYKQVKTYIQENKEIINAAQWNKLLDPAKVQDALYPDEIEELIHILQRVGMPKDMEEIFPGFTHYEDYDKYDDILKELEVNFSPSREETLKEIKAILLTNGYKIRDILDGDLNLGVKNISVGSDTDMEMVLIILYDASKNSSMYIYVEDSEFKKNIIQIPRLGIAYNKDKILNNFRKYMDVIKQK